MSNYSENPSMVRVDQYKRRSGKWYETFAVDMDPYYNEVPIQQAVQKAIEDRIAVNLDDWIYVVNEPYHHYTHPVMLKKFEPDA